MSGGENRMYEMKNTLVAIKNRLDNAKENVNKLKNI